jgi:hypothetical protein
MPPPMDPSMAGGMPPLGPEDIRNAVREELRQAMPSQQAGAPGAGAGGKPSAKNTTARLEKMLAKVIDYLHIPMTAGDMVDDGDPSTDPSSATQQAALSTIKPVQPAFPQQGGAQPQQPNPNQQEKTSSLAERAEAARLLAAYG